MGKNVFILHFFLYLWSNQFCWALRRQQYCWFVVQIDQKWTVLLILIQLHFCLQFHTLIFFKAGKNVFVLGLLCISRGLLSLEISFFARWIFIFIFDFRKQTTELSVHHRVRETHLKITESHRNKMLLYHDLTIVENNNLFPKYTV